MSQRITVEEILLIHRRLIEGFGGTLGIRDRGLLEAAVGRIDAGYYQSPLEEAAALWESLSQNHPFIDGNKRVAFGAAHIFLLRNGFDIEAGSDEIYRFIIHQLESEDFQFEALLAWLKDHCRRI